MGTYNPHIPRILGQEWVPIRDEEMEFSPAVNLYEQGHTFTLTIPTVVRNARFYIDIPAPGVTAGQTFVASLYPSGAESESGPIRRVIIPTSNGAVTGGGASLFGASTVQEALADPTDLKYVFFSTAAAGGVTLSFPMSSYAALLNGKRILGVNLIYTLTGADIDLGFPPAGRLNAFISNNGVVPDSGSVNSQYYGTLTPQGDSITDPASVFARKQFGEMNGFFGGTTLASTIIPWTFTELRRFESGAASPLFVKIVVVAANTSFFQFYYAALEIFYCEERREAVGGVPFGGNTTVNQVPYVIGTNIIPLYTPAGASNPTLSTGEKLLTLSSANLGDLNGGVSSVASNAYPVLNGLRELYTNPPHVGTLVNIPSPMSENVVGRTFTAEETHVLPQISLHTSGGPVTAVHVYGRQAAAQVYGTVTATQEIFDAGLSPATYPQVRYYARRFGGTTIPLTLSSPAIPGSTVSITPDEFDVLDEIIDGWKEVTLEFDTPPTMGGVGNPRWDWSAAGESAGNRWEVLGAYAPALSGIPGNLLNKVPSPNQLSIATYGQPVSGADVNLGWIPGYSPLVSGTADDQTADATLIFAQDMPTVTGLSVVGRSQELVGIGLDCGIDPCGIPTALLYNEVEWSPTSSGIAASGFGFYELQRMDDITDWETIMMNSSPLASGFNDFEARVDILTSYRIRAVDVLNFTGPWSDTVTITTPAPGVSGNCVDEGHLLLFSSNEYQDGAVNLAYSTAWEGRVDETFSFPEAGSVALQAMYGRDYFTAFHPTERGGEQFDRNILVQAAAISPPTLGDFTSLRDMAWSDTNYICVRDEEGNRWFSSVMVPAGSVQNRRRLYLASIRVVEVTATPTPVDPSA